MKRLCMIVVVVTALVFVVSCNKQDKSTETVQDEATQDTQTTESETEETQPVLDEKVAMYRAAVYKDPKQSDWLATLNKGEQVMLVEVLDEPVKLKGKDETIAKVRLSDDTEGYIRERYLADKAIVITDEEVPVFARNNKTSGQSGSLPLGAIAFVVEQKANWLKVTAGDHKIYNKWIESGYSENRELITDAVLVEENGMIVRGEKDGTYETARGILEDIAAKNNELSDIAKEYLEEGSGQSSYEYPDGSQLAKVTASSLRIRKDPNADAEEVTQAPKNKVVAVLEEQDEEVEIGGNTGRWTRVNYEGEEGWAFGAFLEKQ